jgi:hypothetical protein
VKREKGGRRRANFCQVQCCEKKSCQKKRKLPTGSVTKEEKLSEEGATSARFSVERGKGSRRRANF